MMNIPNMNAAFVLPPFLGNEPNALDDMSPYQVNLEDVVGRFGTTRARRELLRGLLSYRQGLRAIGIIDGWQWLNGSFVEDVEVSRGRAPNDLDLVTFAHVPGNRASKELLALNNWDLFGRSEAKARFKCDPYFIDLDKQPEVLVEDTRYVFGLFSHQRGTSRWKGMLRVNLQMTDVAAVTLLDQRERESGDGENAEKT
jgi:hypothetical protein